MQFDDIKIFWDVKQRKMRNINEKKAGKFLSFYPKQGNFLSAQTGQQ